MLIVSFVVKLINYLNHKAAYNVDYFRLPSKKYVYYQLKNGIKYKLRKDTWDTGILHELMTGQPYTPQGFEININDLVIDIGAHVGIFSILAAKQSKTGKVYAFEPMPENFELLRENIKLNGVNNIIPISKAVFDTDGYKKMYVSKNNTGGHSLFCARPGNETVPVETISLDRFVKENNISRIDFLKMDCEGAEYTILINCSKNTLDKICKISMECHEIAKNNTCATLKHFLESAGFNVRIETDLYKILYAIR